MTQISLYRHRIKLDLIKLCIYCTADLRPFVFAYANCWFSHAKAHLEEFPIIIIRHSGDTYTTVSLCTGLGNKHDSDVRECNGKWALPTVVNR